MADTTETLANCPFCGESAEKTAGFDEVETPLFSVWCTECLAQSSPEYSEAEAIAAWNRRTSDGWRTARAEALREAFRILAASEITGLRSRVEGLERALETAATELGSASDRIVNLHRLLSHGLRDAENRARAALAKGK